MNWTKNQYRFENRKGQTVALSFRATESSDWKYENVIYKWVFDVRLETQFGNRFWWFCFAESHFPKLDRCTDYLSARDLPFEILAGYLEGDIRGGLELGAVIPRAAFGVLVVGRPG